MTDRYFTQEINSSEPMKTKKTPFYFKSGVTATFAYLNCYGYSHTIIVDLPSFAASVNATVGICNSDDDDLYTYTTTMSCGSGGARSKYVIEKEVPLFGLSKIRVSLSGNPLSSNIVYVTLYSKKFAAR